MPIPGTTTVGGPVAPSSELDTYAAHSEQWGRGGYRTVADYTERDAITAERRKEGQLVHVLSDDSWWELDAGLTNGNWIIPSFAIAAHGAVSLERNGYPTRWFRPSANTNAARFAALQDAMSVADDNLSVTAIVTLMFGQFGIPSGTSIADFAPVNAIIVFGPESSVLYANEVDAGDDARLYPGNVRYAKNFGAIPDWDVDSHKMIQAALFSLPQDGNPVEPIAKYPSLVTRNGTVYLEGGPFMISDTLYMTGFQKIIGLGGRRVQVVAGSGFAPDVGTEKFMIYVAVYYAGGQPGPNFSFDVELLDLQLATNYFLENPGLSGVAYGCGQGGRIRMTISNMAKRGLWLRPGTMYIEVEDFLGIAPTFDPSWIQTGPHIYGEGLLGVKFSQLSLERLNKDPLNRLDYTIGAYTEKLACIMIASSNELTFEMSAGESNGYYAFFGNCNVVNLGVICHTGEQASGTGGTMVKLASCTNISWEGMVARHYEYIVQVTGNGAMDLFSGNSAFAQIGPMTVNGEYVRTMTANPTTAQIPGGYGYFVKNTTSGEMRFWYNDGGVMKSIGPAA